MTKRLHALLGGLLVCGGLWGACNNTSGQGDAATTPDMTSAAANDLSSPDQAMAAATDMAGLVHCSYILNFCLNGENGMPRCMDSACLAACIARASPAAQAKFNDLYSCGRNVCSTTFNACSGPDDFSANCAQCIGGGTQCTPQWDACQSFSG
jgi:hypothetical protein